MQSVRSLEKRLEGVEAQLGPGQEYILVLPDNWPGEIDGPNTYRASQAPPLQPGQLVFGPGYSSPLPRAE